MAHIPVGLPVVHFYDISPKAIPTAPNHNYERSYENKNRTLNVLVFPGDVYISQKADRSGGLGHFVEG